MDPLWLFYNIFAVLCILIVVLPFVSRIASFIYVFILAKLCCQKKDFSQKYGKWAVVTGGSDGIGKCYAIELAKRKLNVVLISNVKDALKSVSTEIESSFGVQTRIILADFSLGEDEYQRIFVELKDLDIGVLVNNVGVRFGVPNRLEDMTRHEMWTMMKINVSAAISMSHFVLPLMRKNERGLIINIASASALFPGPYAILYASSKAFIKSFSEALRYECRKSGVEVQTVCPSFVDTQMCKGNNAWKLISLLYPSPENFVRSAVSTIGFTSLTTGYWPHQLQFIAMERIFPKWFGMRMMMFYMNTNRRKARSHPQQCSMNV